MAFWDRLYSGFYHTVYGYKLGRFRSKVQSTFSAVQSQMKRKPKGSVDKSKIQRILVVKNEALGDMILMTPLFRNLALNGYKVDVLASDSNRVIIERNPYVNEVLVQQGGLDDIKLYVETLKDRHYDLVIDARFPAFSESVDRLIFPQYFSCDYLISWNRSHLSCYDESLDFYQQKEPIVKVADLFLRYMGIKGADLSYDIFMDEAARKNALHYVRDLWRKGGPVIVFNPFSSHETRDLMPAQIYQTINMLIQRYPHAQIVFIGQPERMLGIGVEDSWARNVHKFHSASIMDAVPLIKYADLVISPDTSIVHIASTFHKPTVGLYIHTVRSLSNGKGNAKREYYLQMQKIKDNFFDEPRIKAGVRPDDILRIEELFAPNNEYAVQLISATGSLSDVPAQDIVNAAAQLIEQYVDDVQYTGEVKAISYQPTF